LAHTETLEILEVLPQKSMFQIADIPQTYRVSRHFTDGARVNTTNEVVLTERAIDNIISLA